MFSSFHRQVMEAEEMKLQAERQKILDAENARRELEKQRLYEVCWNLIASAYCPVNTILGHMDKIWTESGM